MSKSGERDEGATDSEQFSNTTDAILVLQSGSWHVRVLGLTFRILPLFHHQRKNATFGHDGFAQLLQTLSEVMESGPNHNTTRPTRQLIS